MNFNEFKQRYQILTRGDVRVCDDAEFGVLLSDAACQIHRDITPLEKVECDSRNFSVDYHINKQFFIRKFRAPTSGDDEIDFLDENLLEALIYGVARKRCANEAYQKYQMRYTAALNAYEMINFDEDCYSLEQALIKNGWAKPYVIDYALDSFYNWDDSFVQNLDFYMANVALARELGWYKFIQLFIDFQNKKVEASEARNGDEPNSKNYVAVLEREDLKALDRLMSKRILGV